MNSILKRRHFVAELQYLSCIFKVALKLINCGKITLMTNNDSGGRTLWFAIRDCCRFSPTFSESRPICRKLYEILEYDFKHLINIDIGLNNKFDPSVGGWTNEKHKFSHKIWIEILKSCNRSKLHIKQLLILEQDVYLDSIDDINTEKKMAELLLHRDTSIVIPIVQLFYYHGLHNIFTYIQDESDKQVLLLKLHEKIVLLKLDKRFKCLIQCPKLLELSEYLHFTPLLNLVKDYYGLLSDEPFIDSLIKLDL